MLALSANNKEQVRRFKEKLHKLLVQGIALKQIELHYGAEFESLIHELEPIFAEQAVSARALAIRALENDRLVINGLKEAERQNVEQRQHECQVDIDLLVANVRYTYLHELCTHVRRIEGKLSHKFTEKADRVILNKWVGIPFFLL